MKYIRSTILTLIIFVVYSCGRNITISYTVYDSDSVQIIDLNQYLSNRIYDVSDILDSVKVVCLETNNYSLLTNIVGVLVTDERIFVRDLYQMGGIAIFDKQGKFVRRLAKGNGPGEIQMVHDIAYDYYNSELLVLSNTNLIKRYDKDGVYKDDVYLDYPCCKILSCRKDAYILSNIFGNESQIPTFTNYSLVVVDRNFDVRQLLLPFSKSNEIVPSYNVSFEYGDKTIISVPFCDTIYRFENDSLFPYKIIDFSSEKRDIEQYASMQDYIEKVQMSGDISEAVYRGCFAENSTHQIIGLEYGGMTCSLFMDKNTAHIISGYLCTYEPDKAFSISLPDGVFDDWFYELQNPLNFKHNTITSNRYISKEDLADLEQLNEDSNPFIVFYKLKDF